MAKQDYNEIWTIVGYRDYATSPFFSKNYYSKMVTLRKIEYLLSKRPDDVFYIYYRRESDGVEMYLNPPGFYEEDGEPWTYY